MSQSPPVAVCPGPDFLALLAVLGAEFSGFALPLGLHALIDRVREQCPLLGVKQTCLKVRYSSESGHHPRKRYVRALVT